MFSSCILKSNNSLRLIKTKIHGLNFYSGKCLNRHHMSGHALFYPNNIRLPPVQESESLFLCEFQKWLLIVFFKEVVFSQSKMFIRGELAPVN